LAELSKAEARRLSLASLGFAEPQPSKPGIAHVRKLAKRLNAFQIDSVNVLVRAHYVPAFSRLGSYPTRALDDLVHGKREMFEYFAHAACFVPTELYPLCRWRMDIHVNWGGAGPQVKRYVERVYEHVAEHGPVAASALPQAGTSSGNWWGWSDGKRAIETLWRMGRVSIAGRRNFERLYDITERVIPAEILKRPAVPAEEAKKQLLVLGARAMGVGTAQDIAKYFSVENWWEREAVNGKRAPAQTKRLVSELVEDGRLEPVHVEGSKQPMYVVPGAKVPKDIHARALVSPFDPLMWERKWTKSLFDFDYTIEIYVPEPKRVYGYYVLPFLLGDAFAARVDLKADRKTRTLLVPGAFLERGVNAKTVVAELADELRALARWLELDRIEVGGKGDLTGPLGRSLKLRTPA
jgi:hypothetical protein